MFAKVSRLNGAAMTSAFEIEYGAGAPVFPWGVLAGEVTAPQGNLTDETVLSSFSARRSPRHRTAVAARTLALISGSCFGCRIRAGRFFVKADFGNSKFGFGGPW